MRIQLYVNRVPQIGDTHVYRTFVFWKRLNGEVRILEMASIRERLQWHHGLGTYKQWVDYEWAD